MKTQQIQIQPSTKACSYSYNYKNFSFWSMLSNCYYSNSSQSFLNDAGVTFEDSLGSMYFTGNDLLYYPKLTEKLRQAKEYPVLSRTYPVNQELKGMAFAEYFFDHIKKSFSAFQADFIVASKEVNNLINLHGMERQTPIIERIEVTETYRKKLIINGVSWCTEGLHNQNLKEIDYIDIHKLLSLPSDLKVYLEDIVPGTPFVAFKISRCWKNKGRIQWYSLDTCEKVKLADIRKAQ